MRVFFDILEDETLELPAIPGPDGNLYFKVKPVTRRWLGRSELYSSNSKKTTDALRLRNIPGMPSNCYGRHERTARVMTLPEIASLVSHGSGSTRLMTGMEGPALAETLVSFFADGYAELFEHSTMKKNGVEFGNPLLVKRSPQDEGAVPVSTVMRELFRDARQYYEWHENTAEQPGLRSKHVPDPPIREMETPPLTDPDTPPRPEEMDLEPKLEERRTDKEQGDEDDNLHLPRPEATRLKDLVRIYNEETHLYEFYSKVQSTELECMIKERIQTSSAWVECAMIATDCQRCQEDRL